MPTFVLVSAWAPELRSSTGAPAPSDRLSLSPWWRLCLCKPGLSLDNGARLFLLKYHWPGNMRELRNALRHAAILADGPIIRLEHLPVDVVSEIARKDLTAGSQSEASRIETALRYNGGNVSSTARYLGISRATLYRKIQIQKSRKSAQNASKD